MGVLFSSSNLNASIRLVILDTQIAHKSLLLWCIVN
jgi:hypothetical protein